MIKRLFIKILSLIAYIAIPSKLAVIIHKLRGVNIGEGVRIHRFVYIDDYCPEEVNIGSHVGIGAKAIIIAHDRDFENENMRVSYDDIKITKKRVVIKDFAYIGIGSIILPGVSIGEGAVIGAGSVVTKDIPPHSIAVGVPAKVIKTLKSEKELKMVK